MVTWQLPDPKDGTLGWIQLAATDRLNQGMSAQLFPASYKCHSHVCSSSFQMDGSLLAFCTTLCSGEHIRRKEETDNCSQGVEGPPCTHHVRSSGVPLAHHHGPLPEREPTGGG